MTQEKKALEIMEKFQQYDNEEQVPLALWLEIHDLLEDGKRDAMSVFLRRLVKEQIAAKTGQMFLEA